MTKDLVVGKKAVCTNLIPLVKKTWLAFQPYIYLPNTFFLYDRFINRTQQYEKNKMMNLKNYKEEKVHNDRAEKNKNSRK